MSQDAIRISPGSQGLGKVILGRKQHERRHEKSEGMRRVKAWQVRKCTQLAAGVHGTWKVGKGAAGDESGERSSYCREHFAYVTLSQRGNSSMSKLQNSPQVPESLRLVGCLTHTNPISSRHEIHIVCNSIGVPRAPSVSG